ncbi:WD40 repeat-like protein [Ascobolus immersus RN42]|uniref:WD40 repeat-like protein n=1 Tax=Ascobolus immersus RN42 TaxID=1160509 RepID=A0A3N4IB49_ASCIM|nr:WD40 repeat-like protein [Ascobolus immersus RN42]
MNLHRAIDTEEELESLSCSLNQDNSLFSVGLPNGFKIFNSDPCTIQETREFGNGLGQVEMLNRSNYLALVGGGRSPAIPQHRVTIWNDGSRKKIITLEFRSSVKRVRLSRTKIVVVLKNVVNYYSFAQPPEKLGTCDTVDNPKGLCVLSAKHIAFPGRTQGHVQVLDIATKNVSIIPAHTSALAALCISPRGDLIATASEQGTLVRVFSTANCAKVAEFRRGSDHATIYNIAISPLSRHLAVTSDKSTLHVFELPNAGVMSSETSHSFINTYPHAPSAPSQSTTINHTSGSPPADSLIGGGYNTVLLPSAGAKIPIIMTNPNGGTATENKKLGFLNRLPLLPKYFSSEWSFTSAKFEGSGKGDLGWTDEETIVLVSAGRGYEAKWEKFVLSLKNQGGVEVVNDGWKAYLEES